MCHFIEHCIWDNWDKNWSTCSETCGSGTQHKNRLKIQEAENGGDGCNGDAIKYQDCNTHPCTGNFKFIFTDVQYFN